MHSSEPVPLIVTLKLDQANYTQLAALRKAHFPPERNVVPAHVTLFHALPGEQLESIVQTLGRVCAATEQFSVSFSQPRSIGRGVAISITSPELLQVRSQLADSWRSWLSPQDQQRYGPHFTVQNKVSAAAAQALLATLSATWQPLVATGTGLFLWHYLGGPWAQAGEFGFANPEQAKSRPQM